MVVEEPDRGWGESIASARTFLFVPGSRADRFEKALGAGADIVIVDLEDAVAPTEKLTARQNVAEWLVNGGRAVVRVNGLGSEFFMDDVVSVRREGILMLPKAESASDVSAVHEAAGVEVAVIPLIETPLGVINALEICSAPGVVRVAFGNVDFAAAIGVDPDSHAALAAARSHLVYASAAVGRPSPVDGVTTSLQDVDCLLRDVAHARELGFGAKLLIHPAQVAHAARGLNYSNEEREWAANVLRTATGGVRSNDGHMIDAPVLALARRILGNSSS
jgi:citrate lyase subunit beta / citryl-CoA lyase